MTSGRGSCKSVYESGTLWIFGYGLLAAAFLLIAWSLPIASADNDGVMTWVQQHRMVLQTADELLALSAPLLVAAMIMIYHKLKVSQPVLASLALALLGIVAIAIIYAMFALGRLVYPVNGLPIMPETSLLSASQLFAGLHMVAIMLALCVVALSMATSLRMMLVGGVLVAALQLAGTYYAGPVSTALVVAAAVALFGWAVGFGSWYIRICK